MTTLYLCAAGNPEGVCLALDINQTSPRWDQIVLLDDAPEKQGTEILGVRVIGGFGELANHQPGDEAVNLVARSTKGRDGARKKIESFGIPLTSLVHPSSNLRGVDLGHAVTVYQGSVLSALSTVGDHSVIFTQAVLGHGATLGTGAVLAPGAVVNARVKVGVRAYIGSNASVLPDLTVGADATVSANSAAIGDIPEGATALGVPAEVIGAVRFDAAVHGGAATGGVTSSADYEKAEQDIRTLFTEILGAVQVASDTNFFDAGGTSKQALDLQVAIQSHLGISISIVDIFRWPSPALLATNLFGARKCGGRGDNASPNPCSTPLAGAYQQSCRLV